MVNHSSGQVVLNYLLYKAQVELLEPHQPQLYILPSSDIDGLVQEEGSDKTEALRSLDTVGESTQ